jgi:hypothetical protein
MSEIRILELELEFIKKLRAENVHFDVYFDDDKGNRKSLGTEFTPESMRKYLGTATVVIDLTLTKTLVAVDFDVPEVWNAVLNSLQCR